MYQLNVVYQTWLDHDLKKKKTSSKNCSKDSWGNIIQIMWIVFKELLLLSSGVGFPW